MWSDFDSQTNFVINNAWRLISLQDKEISSPSYGSFHYAYWRDKTSEFPDSRFQEAGATIGILSSTKYSKFHGKTLPSKDELYITFSAALKNLAKFSILMVVLTNGIKEKEVLLPLSLHLLLLDWQQFV